MKKSSLLLIIPLLCFASCEKEQDIPVFQTPGYSDKVEVTDHSATLRLTVEPTQADIDTYILLLSSSGDMANAQTIDANNREAQSYTFVANNLQEETTYYYRYVLKGYYSSLDMNVQSFTTIAQQPQPQPQQLVVQTDNPLVISSTQVIAYGNVLQDGGSEVIERGICYSTSPNPTVQDKKIVCQLSGLGAYSCLMENLSPSTKYYVRAYAINSKNVSYGEEKNVTTFSK